MKLIIKIAEFISFLALGVAAQLLIDDRSWLFGAGIVLGGLWASFLRAVHTRP